VTAILRNEGGGFDVVHTPRDTSVRSVLSALFFVVREDE
jgi:hypothetical protein